MKALAVLFLAVALCACASRSSELPITENDVEQNFYVVLPGNYIIDIAAGSEVSLNPAQDEFVIFTSPQKAHSALREELAAGRLNADADWRVFRFRGKPSEVAEQCRKSQLCLTKFVIIEDWVETE